MNETHVTIVGNALHNPEWRRTATTGAMVTTFKIASTARRMDRDSGRWIDGNSLRVRVTCWRHLAENVRNSVTSGDPLIVTGRLYSRDWEDENGAKRTAYELEANAVGHDLSRGRAVFERVKATTLTSTIEDAETEQRIGGELTEVVPDEDAPTQFNDMPFGTALEEGLGFASPPPREPLEPAEPVAVAEPDPAPAEPVAVAEPDPAPYPYPYPDSHPDRDAHPHPHPDRTGGAAGEGDPDGREPDEPGQLEPVGASAGSRRRPRRRT